MARRGVAGILALGLTVAIGLPVAADTGPNQSTTDVSQAFVPITFVGGDGRPYDGTVFVQHDNLTGSTVAGFSWAWRNLVQCDNGTPEPEDDFEGEELIDFTVDSLVPSSFALASNLSSSTGVATGTGHRVHWSGCDGSIVEDVVETHTVAFDVASTGPASRTNSRERIDNGDGTITTIVIRELRRPAAGSIAIDGTNHGTSGADLIHTTVAETTR